MASTSSGERDTPIAITIGSTVKVIDAKSELAGLNVKVESIDFSTGRAKVVRFLGNSNAQRGELHLTQLSTNEDEEPIEFDDDKEGVPEENVTDETEVPDAPEGADPTHGGTTTPSTDIGEDPPVGSEV